MAKKPPPQPAAGYRAIPHTADAGFKLWGASLADIFVQGAYALTSLMTDRRYLQNRQSLEIEVEAPDQEILLVDWLNQLLYLYDTKSFFIKNVNIMEISQQQVKARLAGEELDPARHVLKTGVKAATYHQLSIRPQNSDWEATIIFDL